MPYPRNAEREGSMTLGADFEGVLSAAQTGADWALTSLYQDLHPALLRYLRSHDPREGDDLASEVWVDVARNLNRFAGAEGDFRKWLFTIARRRLLDHRRRSARRRTHPVPSDSLVEIPDAAEVETQAIDTISAQEAIARMVEILPPDQAEAVILRVVAGLTAEEAGAVMGKRPGAIRVLQHRALERLARDLSGTPVTGSPPQAM